MQNPRGSSCLVDRRCSTEGRYDARSVDGVDYAHMHISHVGSAFIASVAACTTSERINYDVRCMLPFASPVV
eukprot:scaffold14290_cov63-Phaeocystis_antarctica.AAC.7